MLDVMGRTEIITFSIFTVLIFIISACNDCRNDGCPDNARFLFEVEDTEGNSLFERTNFYQPLESDKIRIIGSNNFGDEQEMRLWQDGTTLQFNISNKFSKYLIDYEFSKDDTLSFKTETYNDNCCSNIATDYLVEVNSNGNLVSSLTDSTFVFIK